MFSCLRWVGPSPESHTAPVEALAAVASEFSPRIQRYGRHSVVLDVSGLGRLLGDPHTIGEELVCACVVRLASQPSGDLPLRRFDAVCHVAIAPTQIASRLLAAAPKPVGTGLTVVTADVPVALAAIPLDVLQQIAAETTSFAPIFSTFERWGVRSIGDCAALPMAALSARLGQPGVALQRMAQGVDSGPLVPDPDVPRFVERLELEWPIDALEPLSFVLARLLEPLSSALERAGRGAVAIRLVLRLVDRSEHLRMLQLPAPMRDPRVLRTLLVLDLESHPPSAAIDIVTIEVDPAPGRVLQYSLLERARPSPETLATLTARLSALVGESRCGQARLLDSYGPDAFEMRRFAPDDRGHAEPAGHVEQLPVSTHPLHPGSRRVETSVLRRFRPPVAIRVTVLRGRPTHVAIDRRGMPGGVVEQCAGPWRTSGAWWKEPLAGNGPSPWNRDEWDVSLGDGSVCRLFQARDTGRWFIDGVLD